MEGRGGALWELIGSENQILPCRGCPGEELEWYLWIRLIFFLPWRGIGSFWCILVRNFYILTRRDRPRQGKYWLFLANHTQIQNFSLPGCFLPHISPPWRGLVRTVLKVAESKYQSYIIAITCFNEQVLFVGPVVLVLRCRVKDVVLAVVVAGQRDERLHRFAGFRLLGRVVAVQENRPTLENMVSRSQKIW